MFAVRYGRHFAYRLQAYQIRQRVAEREVVQVTAARYSPDLLPSLYACDEISPIGYVLPITPVETAQGSEGEEAWPSTSIVVLLRTAQDQEPNPMKKTIAAIALTLLSMSATAQAPVVDCPVHHVPANFTGRTRIDGSGRTNAYEYCDGGSSREHCFWGISR